MARALNAVRRSRDLESVPLARLRPHVSNGARGMLDAGFGLKPADADFPALREAFLEAYAREVCVDSRWFNGIAALIDALDSREIVWGIVTNKATAFTLPLLQQLGIAPPSGCVVCGDTCARAKPHPDPLLHAASLIRLEPRHCLYIGDDERDITAANAAGMRGVVAMYGYLGVNTNPLAWPAAAWVNAPLEIIDLLR
jgi:phosphoglycolate phosphatase